MNARDYMKHAYGKLHPKLERDVEIFMDKLYNLPLYQLVGGKHFRAILAMLTCQACGGRIEDSFVPAAFIEFVHQSSLIPDDMVDQDPERRGEKALHETMQPKHALFISLASFSKGSEYLSKMSPEEVGYAVNAAVDTFRGFVLEALNHDLRDAPYTQIIKLKTATLFSAAAHLGAIRGRTRSENPQTKYEEACRVYGRELGMAYQIMDDLVDIIKSLKEGRALGDLRERRPTYPLFCLYVVKPEILKIFTEYTLGNAEFNDVAIAIAENNGGITKCVGDIQKHIDKAVEAARTLPPSVYRGIMETIPAEMVGELAKEIGE